MKRIFTSIQEQRNHEMNEAFTNLEKICNRYGFTINDIKIVKIEDNKAIEYSSPIIEELLNETTPEELEKVIKSMENEKMMTAVEWLIDDLGEYFPHGIGGIEYAVKYAKEMERELQREKMIQLLAWMNKVSATNPMALETDHDDIVDMFLKGYYE